MPCKPNSSLETVLGLMTIISDRVITVHTVELTWKNLHRYLLSKAKKCTSLPYMYTTYCRAIEGIKKSWNFPKNSARNVVTPCLK